MLPEGQAGLARELQASLLAAAPQLGQAVKWGNLLFTASGANLLAIVPHRSHVSLQVFNGAALAERFPQLEGTGKGMRHLKCRNGTPLDPVLVQAIARASADLG